MKRYLSKLAAIAFLAIHFSLTTGRAIAEDTPGVTLLANLGSENFATRIQASRDLKELSAKEILQLASKAASITSAETVVRILAEIDNRYSSESKEDVTAASKILEDLASAKRVLLSETAELSLQEHWEKRVTLALATLQEQGAIIKRGTFRRARMAFGRSANPPTMQILITDAWKGGESGIDAFERLAMLMGPVSAAPIGASVYLIAGHNLTEAQQSRLTEIVGQNRVAVRSRVALGIVGNPVISPGVLIESVSKGSSAEAAGLSAGDLLLAIEEQNPKNAGESLPGDKELGTSRTPLLDFQDLVAKLMAYDKDDVMKVRVIRNFRPYMLGRNLGLDRNEFENQPKPEIVEIKLKGWEALGTE